MALPTLTLTQAAYTAAISVGGIDSGGTLSTQQLADALVAANNLLDGWSGEQIMIPQLTKLPGVPLGAGNPGPYGVASQPLAISSAYMQNSSGPGCPVEIVNVVKWGTIPDRQSLSYLVKFALYDRAGNLYVAPVPQGNSLSLELWGWTALAEFADATTPLTMPNRGYARLITWALAKEWASPQLLMPWSQVNESNYVDAIARVRNLNAELLGTEPAAGQTSAVSGQPVPANQGAQ